MRKLTRAMVDALERKVDALEKRESESLAAIPHTMVRSLDSIIEHCGRERKERIRSDRFDDYDDAFLEACAAEMKRSLCVWEAALKGAKQSPPMWPKGLKH